MSDSRQAIEDYFRKNTHRSTAQAVADIERITGIRRGLTQVRKFLKGLGLKFRKLGTILAKADADEQRKFLDERLWPCLRQARRLRRVVRFVDAAAHFVHGTFLGSLWCFTRLLIRGPSGRKRFNVLGAIDAVTHELTTVTNDTTIDATAIRGLRRTLSACHPGLPMTLVLDNARYQRCEPVRLVAAESRIELLYLPACSPNLNPIERLWKFVKKVPPNRKATRSLPCLSSTKLAMTWSSFTGRIGWVRRPMLVPRQAVAVVELLWRRKPERKKNLRLSTQVL